MYLSSQDACNVMWDNLSQNHRGSGGGGGGLLHDLVSCNLHMCNQYPFGLVLHDIILAGKATGCKYLLMWERHIFPPVSVIVSTLGY